MPTVTVQYHIVAVEQDGVWIARATREDTGHRFGPDRSGGSEREAVERLEQWLAWQRRHASALDDLQDAERAYHRVVAAGAFASAAPGASFTAERSRALEVLDAARAALDLIRSHRPETRA